MLFASVASYFRDKKNNVREG